MRACAARYASLWRGSAAAYWLRCGVTFLARMWAQLRLPRVTATMSRAAHSLLKADDCRVEDLCRILDAGRALPRDYPFASEIKDGVIVYDALKLPGVCDGTDYSAREAIQAEMRHALQDGPGALVVRNAFAGDTAAVDEVTAAFSAIAKDEAARSDGPGGDHFAKAGANTRICKRSGIRSGDAISSCFLLSATHCANPALTPQI